MIQDAHPIRSGIPDHYAAKYRIDVIVAATTWNVNMERFPSGFGGQSASNVQARTGVGLGLITFPAGMRVRGAKAGYSAPSSADASQRTVHVSTINEAAGTATLTIKDDTGAVAEPVAPTSATSFDSTIWVELDLETV